jgi:hypothetical protein
VASRAARANARAASAGRVVATRASERSAPALAGLLERALGDELRGRRGRRRRPRHGAALGELVGVAAVVDVEQQRGDVDARHAVGQRVVDLRDEREAPALDAVDEVHLPQRARPVERLREQPAGERGELRLAVGVRQRRVPDVEGQVEARVVDPAGAQEAAGRPREALAVARQPVQAPADHQREIVVGRRIAVEQQDPADVHVRGGVLDLQERSVESAQPLVVRSHWPPLPRWTGIG